MSTHLPVIDIGALASDDAAARLAVARQVGAACRGIGFFAITGHGIPADRLQATFAAAHQLFALPAEAKEALSIRRHGHNRGYVALGVESLNEKAAPDLKEAYNLVWDGEPGRPPNVWPPLSGWREQAQAYFDAALDVGRRLHRAFALDLGLPEDFFADKLDRPMATLRLLRYPPALATGSASAPATPEAAAAQAGAGAHTDYGNVTLLATDGVPGLQVQSRDGRWIDAPHLPGAFLCNIGDCLMRWSNDVYVSTPHRVGPPPRLRHSIAFFLDPNPDALVSALPGCVPAGESPRHPPITAAEHLRQRLEATYGGKAAG
jgi:isopenicillin N synthase-like dioxygenase